MQQLPATDVKVGGGDVERVAFVIGQEGVEDIGHFVLLVVDDEWDDHDLVLLISFFCDFCVYCDFCVKYMVQLVLILRGNFLALVACLITFHQQIVLWRLSPNQ